ncbi:hypothetical protein BTR23_09555 [Alkalihalophilus pseudofirmus]|nr:hypothetical protein BTR23_09555 [Alkalihalophilus pseudofirmus]
MKWIKTIPFILIVVLMTLAGCSESSNSSNSSNTSSGNNDGEENEIYSLRLGHVYSEAHAVHDGALKFAELVKEKTNDRVHIDVYPSSQLGGDPALGEGLQLGTIDLAIFNQSTLTGMDPRLDLGSLMYLVDSYEAADHLYYGDGIIAKEVKGYLGENGMHVLEYFENDFRALTNNVRPVETLEDINGLTIRIPAIEMLRNFFIKLGVTPTVTDLSELYTSLQQGTIDGQDNGALVTYTTKVFEVQDYMTILNHAYITSSVSVSQKIWETLPVDIQEALETAAIEASQFQRDLNRSNVANQLAEMEQAGVHVFELPPEEMERFREVGQSLWQDFESVVGKEVLDSVIKAADELSSGQ